MYAFKMIARLLLALILGVFIMMLLLALASFFNLINFMGVIHSYSWLVLLGLTVIFAFWFLGFVSVLKWSQN